MLALVYSGIKGPPSALKGKKGFRRFVTIRRGISKELCSDNRDRHVLLTEKSKIIYTIYL